MTAPRTTDADPSIGLDGPSLNTPPIVTSSVLEPAPGSPGFGPLALPAVTLTAASLSIPAAVELDAISFGNDILPPGASWHLMFSVSPGAIGNPASAGPPGPFPNVREEAGVLPPAGPPIADGGVPGDIYSSFSMVAPGGPLGAFAPAPGVPSPCAVQSNLQAADDLAGIPEFPKVGLGLAPDPPGAAVGDNVATLDMSDNTVVDFDPPGPPGPDFILDAPVWFSVTGATAGLLPPFGAPANSGADIFVALPGGGLVRWATGAMLGLPLGAEIDALAIEYTSGAALGGGWVGPPDIVRFSLTPASPGLPALIPLCFALGAATGGDAFVDLAPFGAPPAGYVDAEMIGINTIRSGGAVNDNLNSMDVCLAGGGDVPDADSLDNACDFDDDNDGTGDMADNCPAVGNPGQANNDAPPFVFAGNEWISDTDGDACDPDDDNDGCIDPSEAGLPPARDPFNPWDFADTPVPPLPAVSARDGAVALGDVAAALQWFGAVNDDVPNGTGRDYDDNSNSNGIEDGVEYDRSPAGFSISGPPDGAVSLTDVAVILEQFGDAC
jgi:hypothetical protein